MPEQQPKCSGVQDDAGNPICPGPDVKTFRACDPDDGEWFTVQWCSSCVTFARALGYKVHEITVPVE